MPQRPRNDIFLLARTLTHSEYLTLADEAARSSHSTVSKADKPLYLQLVEYLRGKEAYDDDSAKKALGFGTEPSARWRSLKRDTIKMIEYAIDRARSNQSEEVILGQIPARVKNYIRKGLWNRAEFLVDKYLKIAQSREEFEFELILIGLKLLIVQSVYPLGEANKIFSLLNERRKIVRKNLAQVELIQELWARISAIAKANIVADNRAIAEILVSTYHAIQDCEIVQARILFFKIKRRLYFLTGNTTSFVKTLKEALFYARQIEHDYQYFDFYLQFKSDLCFFLLRSGDIDAGLSICADLEQKIQNGDLSEIHIQEAKARLILIKLYASRISLDQEEIASNLKATESWYQTSKGIPNEDLMIRIMWMSGILSFFIGDYSTSAKWSYRMKHLHVWTVRSNSILFSWLFYLMAKYEQKEWDILRQELKPTEKFIKKHCDSPDLYLEVLSFLKLEIEDSKTISTVKRTANIEKIRELSDSPHFAKLANQFEFTHWLESKNLNQPLLAILQEHHHPRPSL